MIRIQIFSSRNYYHAVSLTGTSVFPASSRAAWLFSSCSCSKSSVFVCALRPWSATPAPLRQPRACARPDEGFHPAIPARGPRSPSRHGHGRPRLKAWTGLVAAVTALKTLPGPCRDAVRGCTEVLSEIVFVASVLPDASSLFWEPRARFVATTALTGSLKEPTDAPH